MEYSDPTFNETVNGNGLVSDAKKSGNINKSRVTKQSYTIECYFTLMYLVQELR